MLTVILVIAVLGVCVFLAVDSRWNRHPNERLWEREHRRLIAGGASDSEAVAGATDAVWSQVYTERFRGKTVRSIEHDPETGGWAVLFEDGASLPVLLSEESR